MEVKLLWYFAYGANMNQRVLVERGVHCTKGPIVARVPGHCIDFSMESIYRPGTGDATIRGIGPYESAPEIWGVLYRITPEDLRLKLDKWEHTEDNLYRRKNVSAITIKSHRIEAVAYEAVNTVELLQPSLDYISNIINSAKSNNIPVSYISHLEKIRDTQSSNSRK